MEFTDFILWKFGILCTWAFIYGFIRRRRELLGEPPDSEETD